MNGTVHVIGAGVAGLAAAVRLAGQGRRIFVHEGAGHAGGRCRSYFDSSLERRIDNGNHLVLSGNRAIADYLKALGAEDGLHGPADAGFPFIDLNTGERWTVRPDRGAVPWSIITGRGRIPGTRLREYLRGLRLARAGADATVRQCLGGPGRLFERFWEPLAVGVLNTPAETAAAEPLWPVLRETFGRGRAHCRPLIARVGLSEAFVDPALRYLSARGAEIGYNRRLKSLSFEGDRVTALRFGDADQPLDPADRIVLTVPAWQAAALLPDFAGPTTAHAIVNAHFRLPVAAAGAPLIGLVGGTAQWVFVRGDVASVTVSAADGLAEKGGPTIARLLWPEVCRALGGGDPASLPAWRVVKEKRATIRQTPAEIARRPPTRTAYGNLFLAGDWTDTGLPATIEGAIRSGNAAARAVDISTTS